MRESLKEIVETMPGEIFQEIPEISYDFNMYRYTPKQQTTEFKQEL